MVFVVLGINNVQRAALSNQVAGVVFLVFQLLEIRQHVPVAPAGIAHLGPVVINRGMPANVHHQVELAGAADDLAARLGDHAVIQAGLRNGGVAPVNIRTQQREPEGWVLNIRANLRAACFEHQHPGAVVLAQAAGDC